MHCEGGATISSFSRLHLMVANVWTRLPFTACSLPGYNVQDETDAGVVLHRRANRASSGAGACAVRASGGLRQARRGSARRRGRRHALLGRGRAVVQASRCMRRRPVRVANERRGGGVRCSGKGAGGLQLQAVWALGPKPNV